MKEPQKKDALKKMFMKKFLFLMLLCIGFVSCSSDDDDNPKTDSPITNLEIPASSSDNPIKSGESVTIQGEGFTQISEIWLRPATKSTDVKAEVTSVTTSGISFTVPDVSGERDIVLKQSGEEYTLGKMYFDDSSETIAKKRIIKTVYDGTAIQEFSYNSAGKLTSIKEYDLEVTRGGGYNSERLFKYNNQDLLIEVVYRDAISKEIENTITFDYVDNTTIKGTEVQRKAGEEPWFFTLTLNESRQLINRKDDDTVVKYEYDDNGNVINLSINSVYTGETIYTYKYDDKYSYLSNMGLPLWYWISDYSSITKNYQYSYDGPNNVIFGESIGGLDLFKYDYDEDGYPTTIYNVNENNEKIGEFIYEVIK